MKYLLILLPLLFLGCTDKTQKAQQQVACKDHGGLYREWGFSTLKCNDGTLIPASKWMNIHTKEVANIVKKIK